jgi:osmotically-inducible protein OsmY
MIKPSRLLRHIFFMTACFQLSGCVLALIGGAAATTAVVSTDARSAGTQLDDKAIQSKIAIDLTQRKIDGNINVLSYNKAVLLAGEAPDETARQAVLELARAQPGVTRVHDYIELMPVSSYSSRSTDTWITSKVRSNMLLRKGLDSSKVKIMTDKRVVYLMGIVPNDQSDSAIDVARRTSGVKQVVVLFESI